MNDRGTNYTEIGLRKQISHLQTEVERLRSEIVRIKAYPDYERKANKVRHHPKCDFLDIEFAECDCGAYKQEYKDES